ncbi:MAG TPA: DUF1080 domain-containing protein [Planctomycetota bacterium]
MMILLLIQAIEWEPHPGWKIDGDRIERVEKAGTLWSKETFGDFALRLEFKLPEGGNSGILFRSRNSVEHQVELLADAGRPVHSGSSGSIFRRAIPTSNAAKPAGEWNSLELEVRGRVASVTYNGTKVVDRAVIDDLPFRGPIGLQEHGTDVAFRGVQVKRLDAPRPAWDVDSAAPLTADETKAFMRALAGFVFDKHLKKDSEQRGMIYEYFDVPTGRWIQGEALDTMHDGAWFGAALATAARATGDAYYKELLTTWTLPFYLKMLNHSDTLFNADRDDVDEKGHRWGLEHQLQKGEKGFVPYWWDDGASFSLEAARKKSGKPVFSSTDRLSEKPNPDMRLDGWAHGSSNHLAQDLAILLQTSWCLLREKEVAAEIAEAARNLQDCRKRHGAAGIPAVLAAAGLTNRDAALLRRIGEPKGELRVPALEPGDKTVQAPGFADNQEYEYYAAIAKGTLPKAVALRLVYDAFTMPQLLRIWSDAGEIPPGLGRFDLGALPFKNGRPEAYRSDRLIPMGSRVGPQTMVVCGWALQALEAFPGLWEEGVPVLDGPYGVDTKPAEAMKDVAGFRVAAHPAALLVAGSAKGESVTVRVGAKSGWADVTLRKNRRWDAVNDKGETLRVTGNTLSAPEGFVFEFALPWTSTKDQKPWANLIERGTYEIAGAPFRIASSEARVKAALRRELGEGLRTWKTLFDKLGYIPTGFGRWDTYSDAGGYAHLLKAAAQWLLVLEGKRDWEVQRVPRIE